MFLVVASLAFAKTSTVKLNGVGTVAPTATLKISLDPLIVSASYNLHCKIINNNTVPVDMLFSAQDGNNYMGYSDYVLNGKLIETDQGAVQPGISSLTNHGVYSGGPGNYLTFTNLDNSNSLLVNDCYAVPITG